MAKTILFNDKNYSIDEAALAAASSELKSHLSEVMNGSGAVINFGGVAYSIDSAKLSAAENNFAAYLNAIGGGAPGDANKPQYGVNDPTVNLSGAVPEGAFCYNVEQNGVGMPTGNVTVYDTIPTSPTAGDVLIYGDYKYAYPPSFAMSEDDTGWRVSLFTDLHKQYAENDTGMEVNLPTTDNNQTTYGPILESISGIPVTGLSATYQNCTSMTEAPVIPSSVTSLGETFAGCTSLISAPTIPNSIMYIGNIFMDCTSLMNITFEGTIAQWNVINKGGFWNRNVPATEVVCSDGTVAL